MRAASPRQPARRPRPTRKTTVRRPVKRRGFTLGRVISTLLVVLLGAAALCAGLLYRRSAALQTYLPSLFRHGLSQPTPAEAFPGQPTLNLMVVGRDEDYNDQDQALHNSARSDMLMVAHLEFARHAVSLLSIPRDSRVPIPGHGITKINAAYKYGGPVLSEQTIQQNFGIPSDHYVALDFAGFQQAIDQLGGVDLTVDKQMDYDDNWGHLHIHLKPGFQHLNGQQAMGFVRFRHSDSDLYRIARQQALLNALKAKLRAPQTLARLPALLDTLDAHVASDLSPDQKLALARFVHDTPHEQIQMTTLPSVEVGAGVQTDWAKAAPVIQEIFGVALPQQMASSPLRHRRHRHHAPRLAELPPPGPP